MIKAISRSPILAGGWVVRQNCAGFFVEFVGQQGRGIYEQAA